MLRAFLITLSNLSWAQRIITRWKFSWRMASRFIAGESQADAVEAVRKLNGEGLNATLDFLGENVTVPEEAALSVQELVSLLTAINREKIRANVSVKLSQMGLSISTDLCRANMIRILDTARQYGNFIRIDMEDSSVTQQTIDLYVWLRSQGYENVGIVIQSYLYRSVEDVETLRKFGPRIRIVKGAYKEPADLAFPSKRQVDENYDRITAMLFEIAFENGAAQLSPNSTIPPIPAIATHDPERIEYAHRMAEKWTIPPRAYEFQMLYGIRRDLQQKLAQAGHAVRVYVPYGIRWYPYFMRRLAERPANLRFFLTSLFRK